MRDEDDEVSRKCENIGNASKEMNVDSVRDIKSTKATMKKYKMCKRKIPISEPPVSNFMDSESQEIAWEFAREIAVNNTSISEPASAHVVNILSSYTKLLKTSRQDKKENVKKRKTSSNFHQSLSSERNGVEDIVDTIVEHGDSLKTDHCNRYAQGNLDVSKTDNETVNLCSNIKRDSSVVNNGSCETTVECFEQNYKRKQNKPEEEMSKNSISKAASVVSSRAEDVDDFKSWYCSLCSFKNNAFLAVCEMCETPRYRNLRKLTNVKCSTDNVVARKRKEIFKKNSENNKTKLCQKKCGKNTFSNSSSTKTMDDNGACSSASENCELDKIQKHKPKLCALSKNPEVADKSGDSDVLDKPVIYRDCPPSDIDIFQFKPTKRKFESPNESNIMSSYDTDTLKGGLMGTEHGFDDIVNNKGRVCLSCKNHNFDNNLNMCSSCGLSKIERNFHELVSGLEDDGDCWQCEDCGEFSFGDALLRKCEICRQKDKQKRKPLAEIYKSLSHLLVDIEESDEIKVFGGKMEVVEKIMFRLSRYTDRVYLYNEVRFQLPVL